MSRIPYRALMRPQRTPPTPRPNSLAAPMPATASEVVEPVVEAEKPADPPPVVEAEPVVAPSVEPVAPAAEEKVEEATPVEPVVVPEPVTVVEPVAVAPAAPKVNSASSKTDLLATATALGLTSVSATNTRAEIWAAIQSATTSP